MTRITVIIDMMMIIAAIVMISIMAIYVLESGLLLARFGHLRQRLQALLSGQALQRRPRILLQLGFKLAGEREMLGQRRAQGLQGLSRHTTFT